MSGEAACSGCMQCQAPALDNADSSASHKFSTVGCVIFIVYSVSPCFPGLNNLFSDFNCVNLSLACHRNLNNPEVCLLRYTMEAIVLKMGNDTLSLEKVAYLEKVDTYAFVRF